MALPPGPATAAPGRVDYFDAGAALGPVVVLAAWALGGLLLLMVVTGNRRRGNVGPAALPDRFVHGVDLAVARSTRA